MKERETTLDRTLKPLADLLDEYKRNLAEFDKQHVGALGEVKSRADELLAEQRRTQAKLAGLISCSAAPTTADVGARSSSPMCSRRRACGRTSTISSRSPRRASRVAPSAPTVSSNMPNGSRIAIDAKFPFDAFESVAGDERR